MERRSGTLWESRYKSSPVQADPYLLACCRYIELNPVRATMVAAPDAYPWSSYRMRMGQLAEDWLDRDPCYLDLGTSEAARQTRYAQFVQEAIPAGEWELIQEALQRGQLTGGNRFVDEVEGIIGRRIEHRPPGRPVKEPA